MSAPTNNNLYTINGAAPNYGAKFKELDGTGLDPYHSPTGFSQGGSESFSPSSTVGFYRADITNAGSLIFLDSYNAINGGTIGYLVNGTDIGAKFRHINYVELALPNTPYSEAEMTSANSPETFGVKIDTDGHVYTLIGGVFTDQGVWLGNGATASDYQVRFTKTAGNNFSGLTSGTFYAITSDRQIQFTDIGTPTNVTFTIKIEKILDAHKNVEVAGNYFEFYSQA